MLPSNEGSLIGLAKSVKTRCSSFVARSGDTLLITFACFVNTQGLQTESVVSIAFRDPSWLGIGGGASLLPRVLVFCAK